MSAMKEAFDLAVQREVLAAQKPVCPNCSSRQIQLINWPTLSASWRCRECKTNFQFERNSDGR